MNTCERCGEQFEGDYRKDIRFRNKNPARFCSKECAHARTYSPESIEQKRQSGLQYWDTHEHSRKVRVRKRRERKAIPFKECPTCHKPFQSKGQYCSHPCASKRNQKKLTDYQKVEKVQYGYLCRFTFGISSYPKEFKSDLIKQYGRYSAKNRGNNLTGVSRDHLYSVNDGFKNSIDPKIMKHPANCQLLPHKENQHKRAHSSITYEELLERIEKWNKKYGAMGEIGHSPVCKMGYAASSAGASY